MVGMEVRTSRAIKNGAGIVVPKGKTVKIASFGRAFTVKTEECPHCGLSAYISGVTRDDVELVQGIVEGNMNKTFNPCDECGHSFTKQNLAAE